MSRLSFLQNDNFQSKIAENCLEIMNILQIFITKFQYFWHCLKLGIDCPHFYIYILFIKFNLKVILFHGVKNTILFLYTFLFLEVFSNTFFLFYNLINYVMSDVYQPSTSHYSLSFLVYFQKLEIREKPRMNNSNARKPIVLNMKKIKLTINFIKIT